jgi:hypothetical protein
MCLANVGGPVWNGEKFMVEPAYITYFKAKKKKKKNL